MVETRKTVLPTYNAVEQKRKTTMAAKTPIYFAVATLRDRETIETYLAEVPNSEYVAKSCDYSNKYGSKKDTTPVELVRDTVIDFVYQISPYSTERFWDLRGFESRGLLNEKTEAEQADLEKKAQEWDEVAKIWITSLEKVLPSNKTKVTKTITLRDHPSSVLSPLSSLSSDYLSVLKRNAHAYAEFLTAQTA